MLPPSPLTDPDVQISRIRFLTEEVRSRIVFEGKPHTWKLGVPRGRKSGYALSKNISRKGP